MKERDGSPAWAFEHLRGRLPKDVELLNAVSFRRGLFEGLVLVNTTDGAALVTKGLVGKPQSAVLSFPDRAFAFQCLGCGARNMITDGDPSKGVKCAACGVTHRIVRVGGRGSKRRTAGRATPRPATRKRKTMRPYRRGPYTLYARPVTSRGGRTQTFYFFSRGRPKSGKPSPMPTGYEVSTNNRSGLPILRRKRKSAAAPTKKTGRRYRPQCLAITSDGKQCRNSSRKGSDYCAAHKGYQPPARGANILHKDTTPRHRKAPDTLPRLRKTRSKVTVAQ